MDSPNGAGTVAVAPAEMPFFVSLDVRKADPATRKLIRSHAMRGRKQKRVQPSSRVVGNGRVEAEAVDLGVIPRIYTPPTLSRIGSDLSFTTFPEDLELSMLLNITKSVHLEIISARDTLSNIATLYSQPYCYEDRLSANIGGWLPGRQQRMAPYRRDRRGRSPHYSTFADG